MSAVNDKSKSGVTNDNSVYQTLTEAQIDDEETVKSPTYKPQDDDQTVATPIIQLTDDEQAMQMPDSEAKKEKKRKPSEYGRNSVLINFALWLSIIASSIIIFAFLSGITSVQEILDYIANTPLPPTLLSGSPRKWLPSPEDLPEEMKLSEDFSYSNEDIAKQYDNPVEVFNKLKQWGRSDNLIQKYLNKEGCGSKAGFREVSVQAILFETVSGAEELLDWHKTNLPARLKSTRVNSTEQVGENGFIFWFDDESNCTPPEEFRYVEIMFQRYNAMGVVWVGAVTGTVSEDQMQSLAIRLAQLVDLKFVAEANK